MNLLIDIGNTRLKWVFAGTGALPTHGELDNRDLSHDTFQQNALQQIAASGEGPEAVWVSSVANDTVLQALEEWLHQQWDVPVNRIAVEPAAGGLRNAYHDQDRLGVDRWLAAIGARSLCPSGNLIVIDAGTAVTIDLVTEDHVYQGGTILPGFTLMHDALVGKTAGIESALSERHEIVGKTTSECVNSGVFYGLVGAVDRIIDEIDMSLDPEGRMSAQNIKKASSTTRSQVMITGGAAQRIASLLRHDTTLIDNLVLCGLHRLTGQQSDITASDRERRS